MASIEVDDGIKRAIEGFFRSSAGPMALAFDGIESVENDGDGYKVTVKASLGPLSARPSFHVTRAQVERAAEVLKVVIGPKGIPPVSGSPSPVNSAPPTPVVSVKGPPQCRGCGLGGVGACEFWCPNAAWRKAVKS